MTGDPVEGGGIGGEIGEVLSLSGVEVPRPHDVRCQPGGSDVDPVFGGRDLVHTGVGGLVLVALTATPGGDGVPGPFGGGGFEEACVLS